jgi:hypothetical protein
MIYPNNLLVNHGKPNALKDAAIGVIGSVLVGILASIVLAAIVMIISG